MKKFRIIYGQMYRSLYFPPAIIFVIIMIAAIFGWQGAKASLDQDIAAEASSKTDTAQQTLREHMVAYEQILYGGAGLFQSSDVVTLEEWESFLSAFNIDNGYSGVQGIGFVKEFANDELPAISSFMAGQGVKDFKIIPGAPDRERYAAVLYVHSVESTQNLPFGYDMYSEPSRRATMVQARDSGHISMSPLIELLPRNHENPRLGFSMFAPYYNRTMPRGNAKQREAALEGYVYATFLANVFFKNIIGSTTTSNDDLGFIVTSQSDGAKQILYESPTYQQVNDGSNAVNLTRGINLYGQTWNVRFAYSEKSLVSEEQLNRPAAVLFFGIFSAILISAIVLLLLSVRARDLSTQKEKAVELAKDELLSLASHQLRTPATGVKQYVGMVLQGFAGKVSASQRNLLEKAYASNDRQLRIINEILHLAKIESGRIVLAKQLTNLNDLVKDILNEQRPDIETAEHNVKIDLPKKPLVIHADTHMLRMAIENLLSNSIKYTPKGGKIDIRVHKSMTRAFISITDTGVGIRQEDSDKIFRQFSRLSNNMSQQVGGTGIGLYLSKHLVELHKGSITFESEPGKGSTFTIEMPLFGGSD